MEPITIQQAQVLTSPNPFALVVSRTPEGGANLTAVSWWTYVSNRPPIIALSLSQRGFGCACVARTGTFTLCVPDETMARQALFCGTVSGRTVNKAEAAGIPLRDRDSDFPPVVEGSQLALLCRLEQAVPAGDHTLYLARAEQILGDAAKRGLKAYDGYRSLK